MSTVYTLNEKKIRHSYSIPHDQKLKFVPCTKHIATSSDNIIQKLVHILIPLPLVLQFVHNFGEHGKR